MADYELETNYRVYDNGEGVCIEVREWPEVPGVIELHTNAYEACTKFYGENSLILQPKQARLLASALLKQADHIEEKERNDARH